MRLTQHWLADHLDDDELAIVSLIHDFVDKEVKPVVRELEHANTYPEALIEQMKALGVSDWPSRAVVRGPGEHT